VPRFRVRVGYDWITPCYRDVEIDAEDAGEAGRKAIDASLSDKEFWLEAVDCEGEAGPTEVLELEPAEADRQLPSRSQPAS
jgi:hypothetical protein